jgi:hypothetical protein
MMDAAGVPDQRRAVLQPHRFPAPLTQLSEVLFLRTSWPADLLLPLTGVIPSFRHLPITMDHYHGRQSTESRANPAPEVIVPLWMMLSFATLLLGTRIYFRVTRSSVWWDDLLLVGGWVSRGS